MPDQPRRYRRLETGEIIHPGDECDACRDPWHDEPKWEPANDIGGVVPDQRYPAHRIYRRAIFPTREEVK